MKYSDFVKAFHGDRGKLEGYLRTQVGVVRWLGLSTGLWSEITVGSWIPNEARANDIQNLDVLQCE
jgi:hypothetical protein